MTTVTAACVSSVNATHAASVDNSRGMIVPKAHSGLFPITRDHDRRTALGFARDSNHSHSRMDDLEHILECGFSVKTLTVTQAPLRRMAVNAGAECEKV